MSKDSGLELLSLKQLQLGQSKLDADKQKEWYSFFKFLQSWVEGWTIWSLISETKQLRSYKFVKYRKNLLRREFDDCLTTV